MSAEDAMEQIMKACKMSLDALYIPTFDVALLPQQVQEVIAHKLPYDSCTRQIIPGLFGMFEGLWSKQVKQFVDERVTDQCCVDNLVRLSGEGKTCRLLAYGIKRYLIFNNCTQTNIAHTQSNIFFRDDAYAKMVMEMREYLSNSLDHKFV
jgi:hypothetical protein